MAAESSQERLQDQVTCSICLDFFTNPVILDCGHNFCRTCIVERWGESPSDPACPRCGERVQARNLRPNRQLATVVKIVRELSNLPKPEAGEGMVCERHQEPLKLFCQDEEAPICVVCDRTKRHRDHDVVPVEEAAQEFKDQICSRLEILEKEREKLLQYKADTEKESRDLLKQIGTERDKMVAEFRQLHQFLEEEENLLLAQMEEVEKEIAQKRDEHLARVSEELSSLEKIILEVEEKHRQPAIELLKGERQLGPSQNSVLPHSGSRREPRRGDSGSTRVPVTLPRVSKPSLLQKALQDQLIDGVRSTLQRCEKKELFANPVAFPLDLKWKIWEFCDMNPLLKGVLKQFKDTLGSRPQLQKANVTLDPDTAHPFLILSADCKSVRRGRKRQDWPDHPGRFNKQLFVLGREGFTTGLHFWDVTVGGEEGWAVGVARRSVRRKEKVVLHPWHGIWAVGKWGAGYRTLNPPNFLPGTLSGEPRRIRVTLNCTHQQVAFFDADTGAQLFAFPQAFFCGETILPFFCVYVGSRLSLSP